MSAQEALDFGLVDEIITKRPPANTWHSSLTIV
jgi:ATP-dependent protease ClpP protease subunit